MKMLLFILITVFLEKEPVLPVYESIRVQGEMLYRAGDYSNALLMYKKYYQYYQKNEAAKIIADCYWNLGNYDSAFIYLGKAVDQTTEGLFRSAEIYARRQNYKEACKNLDKALVTATDREKEKFLLRKKGFSDISRFLKDSADWTMSFLAVNTKANETAPIIYNDELYILSNRQANQIYPNDASFHYLYRVGKIEYLKTRQQVLSKANQLEYRQSFASDISLRSSADNAVFLPGMKLEKLPFTGTDVEKVKGIIGAAYISSEGTMYFSKLYFDKTTRKYHAQLVCKRANKKLEMLSINDEQSSSIHPFISEDGKTLYFSSNRTGGKGGYDLYISHFINGSWSRPQNLSHLNTPGDDMYPSIFSDKLYFTSNGWPGLGGLDIYYSTLHTNETPENLGYPLNSSADDQGIRFKNSNSGFIASNRFGGEDILGFDFKPRFVHVKGFVITAQTGRRMSDVSVYLEQKNDMGGWDVIEIQKTNHTGIFDFPVKPNRNNYRVRLVAKGFREQLTPINTEAVTFSTEEKIIHLISNE